MLDDGLFTKFPKPDMALALHVDATLETGKVGYRAGYSLANVDSVDITMHGRGGHGAAPHTTIDPIVQAAQLIVSLQTIVSREMNPIEPAVVTVGSIHGGTKHNVIPDTCHLQLTVRSFTDEVRAAHLLDGIRRKANAVAAGAGAPKPTVEVLDETYAGPVQRREAGRAGRADASQDAGRRQRRAVRAVDGGRGFQPLRPGRRADVACSAWARSSPSGWPA